MPAKQNGVTACNAINNTKSTKDWKTHRCKWLILTCKLQPTDRWQWKQSKQNKQRLRTPVKSTTSVAVPTSTDWETVLSHIINIWVSCSNPTCYSPNTSLQSLISCQLSVTKSMIMMALVLQYAMMQNYSSCLYTFTTKINLLVYPKNNIISVVKK